MFRVFRLLLVTVLGGSLLACASSPTGGSAAGTSTTDNNPPILIAEQGDSFILTVSLSDITMSLPKGSLRRATNPLGGATASKRYFWFSGPSTNVSGWFEGSAQYTDLRARLQVELERTRRIGVPDAIDLEDVQAGQLTGVLFTRVLPQGTSSHLRSTYLSRGTWVDLHLSYAANVPASQSRAKVLELARSIRFAPKAAQ